MRAVLSAAWLCLLGCSQPFAGDEPRAASEPIVGGTLELDFLEVVLLVKPDGAHCTGTLIGPSHVLTAKHCIFSGSANVAASSHIAIGSDYGAGLVEIVPVLDSRTTPGAYTDAETEGGTDIAVVLLERPLDLAVRSVSRTKYSVGTPVEILGYGRTIAGETATPGDTRTKYRGTTRISGYTGPAERVVQFTGESWTCFGDSGGPALSPTGEVIGVSSYVTSEAVDHEPYCFNPTVSFTRTDVYLDLIDMALTWEPPCVSEEEVCNGADDNCDGRVDEGCGELGSACEDGWECEDRFSCGSLGDGGICTVECDPTAFESCEAPLYCHVSGYRAECAVGLPGPRNDGQECSHHLACATRHCGSAEDGRRCGPPCVLGESSCPAGHVCSMGHANYGVCLLSSEPPASSMRMPDARPTCGDAGSESCMPPQMNHSKLVGGCRVGHGRDAIWPHLVLLLALLRRRRCP